MLLLQCLKTQLRVISALVFRELNTRFGRENIGFLWFIGEPVLFCGGVSILWTIIRPPYDNGIPMTAFVITGYVPLTLWRHCISRALRAFGANGSLLFHRHVTPLDIILARVIIEVMGTLIAGVLVSYGAIMLGYMKPPADIGLVYAGLAYQTGFSLAAALLVSALSEMSELVEKFMAVVLYLSLPFSGAFTMAAWLPKTFQDITLYSPSVHATEMIRAGEFGGAFEYHYSFAYATWSIVVILVVGLILTLNVRKYIVVQ